MLLYALCAAFLFGALLGVCVILPYARAYTCLILA